MSPSTPSQADRVIFNGFFTLPNLQSLNVPPTFQQFLYCSGISALYPFFPGSRFFFCRLLFP